MGIFKKETKGRIVEGIGFNAYSQEKFDLTLNELRSEYDAVKALGLLG
jgi:malate dehydrogenase